jgi:hypothetical protein
MRESIELEDLSGVSDAEFEKPVRLIFASPRRGGPRVTEIRAALAPKGKLRLSGTPASIFADLDPGEPEAPLITLDTIVRSDAAGLERMLLTSLPHVDAIVLGIDGRSDEETTAVARLYADVVHVFWWYDIDMDSDAWKANKIDFPRARNIGRSLVQTSWTFVIDSDEYIASAPDIRALVAAAQANIGSFRTTITINSSHYQDAQRLTLTKYRWEKSDHGSHNQLRCTDNHVDIDMVIVSDTRLREHSEQQRREDQRERGIEDMVAAAAAGDLSAIFHVAKHRTSNSDLAEAVKLVENYRSRVEVNSILAEDRAWLALALAFRFYTAEQPDEATRWACRALLDGPSVAAFCVLGDVAEGEGRLQAALQWYQAACSMEETGKIKWPGLTELRFGRLSGIQRALKDPETTTTIGLIVGDEPSDS